VGSVVEPILDDVIDALEAEGATVVDPTDIDLRRWAEPELNGLAHDFEQATKVRVPPTFIPTIGDDLFPGLPSSAVQVQRQQATQGQHDLAMRFR
jgi:hypothetical protein